jgi:hypothetical protein
VLNKPKEAVMVTETAIQECKNRVRGEMLCPTDDGYELARKVFNAMIDKRPALIVRCTGAADVIECVRFAREHDLMVSVRGGGHSVAGKAVCDGGLMIDLSRLKGIRVDPARRTVRAEAGLTLGEFDRETQAFGLATTLGAFSTTGIAGLTLGGGLGWLMGKFGLACDNLLSVDVVTADGRLLTASATEHADLFWGVRGGSGNFGIITSFEYQLHPVGPVVLAGAVFYPETSAKAFLRFYREFASSCPDELSTQAGIMTTLDGNRIIAAGGCYCGPLAEGEKLLKPLRTFATPLADVFGPMPYVDLQRMLDEYFPPGHQNYWKSNFLHALSDEAIDVFVECAARRPAPQVFNTAIWLEHMHGIAARVGVTETAFSHRQHEYNFSIFSIWPDPAHSAEMMAWTRQSWDALRPFMASGAYVNYLEEESDPTARAAYGGQLRTLDGPENQVRPH